MSTPPRKPRNPENIFRRGNEHNIKSKREGTVLNQIAAIAAKQRARKQKGEELQHLFNQPANQFTTLNYTPNVNETALLYVVPNKEKGIERYNFMDEARKLQAQHEAVNAFRRAKGIKTKKNKSNENFFSKRIKLASTQGGRRTRHAKKQRRTQRKRQSKRQAQRK